MAGVQNFIKWIKERTRKQNKSSPKASIMRLGKLPPVPPMDEYGFTIKSEHIYEEIHTMTSDEESESLKSSDEVTEICNENFSQTLQKFDFTHAKEIGPYLVVPIVSDVRDGDESCDSGTGDLADLILCGSVNDSRDSNSNTNRNNVDNTTCSTPRTEVTYDYSKSLYNAIPAWARAKLKDAQCKRHGLALQESKEKAKESNSAHDETFNEYSITDLSSISSCSDRVFRRGQGSKLTNRCCGSSDSSDSAKTFSEYDIGDYDDPVHDKNYEYFLVKAEKNFLLEKELKRYIDATSDSMVSSSSSSQSDSMSLTTVTSMSDLSTIFSPGLSRSDSDTRMSDESVNSSTLSDESCHCCRGQENSLFCAKASKSVNSVLLVHKTSPRRESNARSQRNRSSSREWEKMRDSEKRESRKGGVSKSNGAYHSSKPSARRRSVDDLLSSKSPVRRRSVDDIISNTSECEYKFTRSNTVPTKELEKQIRRDMRKSQRDSNEKSQKHLKDFEKSRKNPNDLEKSRKLPKEYKLPGVSKEYVFTTDSEYKFCTLSNSKSRSSLTRANESNSGLNRNSERYSCRATDFVPKKTGRVSGGATVSSDDTYGSIYGTLRGRASQAHCQNRLLGDMMRRNHDRQLFF
ncbi:uncharacterized protein LOC135502544 [Lineus longissimus]|uniref:uncharacterized protein LOC135502544 n=1 Tax=Lineus longissimus TaxID=88925 RepID=UPI002B4E377A